MSIALVRAASALSSRGSCCQAHRCQAKNERGKWVYLLVSSDRFEGKLAGRTGGQEERARLALLERTRHDRVLHALLRGKLNIAKPGSVRAGRAGV